MKNISIKNITVFLLLSISITVLCGCPDGSIPPGGDGYILIDHLTRDITDIPDSAIEAAKNSLHIAYNHTSHGSQLITGMNALENFPDFGGKYSWSGTPAAGSLHLEDRGIPGIPDLSQGDSVNIFGVTPWVSDTRTFLDDADNDEINVVVWSWCSINGHYAQRYLDNMEKLIAEYPDIQFVFMTGHAQGQGESSDCDSGGAGNVHYNNELIRAHCSEYKRILFDFADIEAWDPDKNYYWDADMSDNLAYNGGNWAVEWIAANPGSLLERLTTGNGVDGYGGCQGTAHSDSPQEANINGVLKGMAAWHLWARLAGWSG